LTELLSRTAQSLTGRVHIVTVWPLSQGEITDTTETFLATLLADDSPAVPATPSPTTREQYVERVLAGDLRRSTSSTPDSVAGQLRNKLGDIFVCGVLLYLGERGAHVDDRLYVLPLGQLWSR
jgi:uncharacterized protein